MVVVADTRAWELRKQYWLRTKWGTVPDHVPVGPVLAAVRDWRFHGFSDNNIGAATDISPTTIWLIHQGVTQQVERTTEVKILGVSAAEMFRRDAPAATKVPAWSAARRLRALCAIGWSLDGIGLGKMPGRITARAMVAEHIFVRNHWAAVDAYDRLSMTPGPSWKAKSTAVGKGWPPPLAWEPEDFDDPWAVPFAWEAGGVEDTPMMAAFVEDTEWLIAAGLTPAVICQRLGVRGKDPLATATQRFRRSGHADLARRFDTAWKHAKQLQATG